MTGYWRVELQLDYFARSFDRNLDSVTQGKLILSTNEYFVRSPVSVNMLDLQRVLTVFRQRDKCAILVECITEPKPFANDRTIGRCDGVGVDAINISVLCDQNLQYLTGCAVEREDISVERGFDISCLWYPNFKRTKVSRRSFGNC